MVRGIEKDQYVDKLEEQRQIGNRLGNRQLSEIAVVCSWGDFLGRPMVTPMDRRKNELVLEAASRIEKA